MELKNIICNLCASSESILYAKGPDFEYHCSNDIFHIVQCQKCGLVYLNPRPVESELPVIYPPHYIPYRFDEHLSPLVFWLRMFVQKTKVIKITKLAKTHANIFDVGCGGGFFLECLQKYGNKNWKLTGVDMSSESIEKIKKKVTKK